jgi:hypothetical protein
LRLTEQAQRRALKRLRTELKVQAAELRVEQERLEQAQDYVALRAHADRLKQQREDVDGYTSHFIASTKSSGRSANDAAGSRSVQLVLDGLNEGLRQTRLRQENVSARLLDLCSMLRNWKTADDDERDAFRSRIVS